MTFDRYHLTAKLSEAIDAVRREEVTAKSPRLHVLPGLTVMGRCSWEATNRVNGAG